MQQKEPLMMELGRQEAKVYFFDDVEFNNDYNLYKSPLKENWDSYFVGRETNINVIDIIENDSTFSFQKANSNKFSGSVFYIVDDDILWLETIPHFTNGNLTWHGVSSRLFSVRALKRKRELFTNLNLLTSQFGFIDSVWKIIDRNDKIKKIIDG
jgi:hypothetical protein